MGRVSHTVCGFMTYRHRYNQQSRMLKQVIRAHRLERRQEGKSWPSIFLVSSATLQTSIPSVPCAYCVCHKDFDSASSLPGMPIPPTDPLGPGSPGAPGVPLRPGSPLGP